MLDVRHGDCLNVLPTIPDASVDMILTDLPYGTTRCAWDSIVDLPRLWREYLRIAKRNAAIVLTAAQPFASLLVSSQPRLFRYDWIWEKGNATGHLNAKKMPLRAHEHILVFYAALPLYNPQKTSGHARKTATRRDYRTTVYNPQTAETSYDSTDRYPRSVLRFASDKQRSRLHPTQKPLALIEYLVSTYTNRGGTVLDSCMGSGTTGVACARLARSFIGIEQDAQYFAAARQRILLT